MDPLPAAVRAHLRADVLPWYASDAWRPELSRSRDDGGWRSAAELADPAAWPALARAYADDLATVHLAPGAACALQHYTGRLLGVVVTVWALTGRLVDLDRDRWWAYVDRRGATTGVRHTPDVLGPPADATALGTAVVAHLEPLVAGARAASRLTAATAWGGPAASLAGAFGRVHARVEPAHAAAVAAAAVAALAPLDEAAGRRLVTTTPATGSTSAGLDGLLHQDRHTCCLIRLGAGNGACGTCPQVPADERRARQRAAHPAARRAGVARIAWHGAGGRAS